MKTVLITGANRGIGRELVHQYWSEGWRVIACSRAPSPSDTERLVHAQLDITDPSQIKKLATHLENESIDVLINNAGLAGPSNEELDLFSLEPFHVNALGPYMLVQALLNHIERSDLKIIANISSAYGSIELNDRGDYTLYRASKAAQNAITKCLSLNLKEKGITVVSIHPGSVRTDMNPRGKISPSESAQGVRKVIHGLRLEESGSFFNYMLESLPW